METNASSTTRDSSRQENIREGVRSDTPTQYFQLTELDATYLQYDMRRRLCLWERQFFDKSGALRGCGEYTRRQRQECRQADKESAFTRNSLYSSSEKMRQRAGQIEILLEKLGSGPISQLNGTIERCSRQHLMAIRCAENAKDMDSVMDSPVHSDTDDWLQDPPASKSGSSVSQEQLSQLSLDKLPWDTRPYADHLFAATFHFHALGRVSGSIPAGLDENSIVSFVTDAWNKYVEKGKLVQDDLYD